MILQKCFILITFVTLCFSPNVLGSEYYYIMKPGESLSRLLYKNDIKPIYHKWGTLRALEEYNSNTIFNSDYVLVGEKILFPAYIVKLLEKNKSIAISKNKEIHFITNKKVTDSRLPAQETPSNSTNPNPTTTPVPTISGEIPNQNQQTTEVKKINSPLTSPANVHTVIDSNKKLPLKVYLETTPTKQKSLATENEQSLLTLALGSGYSRIDSSMTSGKAVLLSKPASNFLIDWEQLWSEEFHSSISWGYESIPYQSASVGSVYNSRQNITHFQLGMSYLFLNKLWLGLYFGQKENVYITSNVQSTATLETIADAYTKLILKSELYRKKRLSIAASFDVSSLSPTSTGTYDIKSGTLLTGRITLKQQFNKFSFFMSGEYSTSNQNTSLTTQSGRDIKSYLGFSIPLGDTDE